MKESIERITVWAKAHPALAVGIVAILIVIGYLIYKKTGGTAVTTPTGAAADTSGASSGGGGASPDLSTTPLVDTSAYYSGTLPPAVADATPVTNTTPVSYSPAVQSILPTATPAQIFAQAVNAQSQKGGGTPAGIQHYNNPLVTITYRQTEAQKQAALAGSQKGGGSGSRVLPNANKVMKINPAPVVPVVPTVPGMITSQSTTGGGR